MQALVAVEASDFNLTRAARTINGTQPGISQSISSLENETGLRIFERSKTRLSGLTQAGRELLPIATRIVRDAEAFQATCRRLAAPPDRTLTVAMGPAPTTLLPGVISKFGRKYPHLKVRVHFHPVEHIIEQIASGAADICLCSALSGLPNNVQFEKCFTLGWDLLAPREHPILRCSPLRLEDVAPYPIITYDETFSSFRHLAAAFARSDIEPNFALGLSDLEEMKRCARAGRGIAIIRSSHVQNNPGETLSVVSLDHILEPTPVFIGVHPDEAGNSPVRYMAHLFRQEAALAQWLRDGPAPEPGSASRPTRVRAAGSTARDRRSAPGA